MNQTTKIISIAVVVAVIFFFAGNAYGKHKAANAVTATVGQYGSRSGGFAGGMRGGAGGGIVSGTVVSADANSITVQSGTAGSKIVLVSPSTTVAKSVTGSLADIAVGSTVTVIGTANSDGSVSATSVQIRPTGGK